MTRKQLVDALIRSMDEEPDKWSIGVFRRQPTPDEFLSASIPSQRFQGAYDVMIKAGFFLASVVDIGRQPGLLARFRLNRAVHRLARRKIAEKLKEGTR